MRLFSTNNEVYAELQIRQITVKTMRPETARRTTLLAVGTHHEVLYYQRVQRGILEETEEGNSVAFQIFELIVL
jgi:hypothetical protein